MVKFNNATRTYSNFITPPDLVEDERHNVLVIDADEATVEQIISFCRTTDKEFNVYLYNHNMKNVEWLFDIVARADALVVNTDFDNIAPIKDRLCEMDKTYYYGPKRFLVNSKHIDTAIDYFIQYKSID